MKDDANDLPLFSPAVDRVVRRAVVPQRAAPQYTAEIPDSADEG